MKKQTVTKVRARRVIKELVEVINSTEIHDKFTDGNAAAVRDIITFLRGPDDDNQALKDLTTSQIRGAIGITLFGSGLIVYPWKNIQEPTVFPNWQRHHRSHYLRAVAGLRHLGYIK